MRKVLFILLSLLFSCHSHTVDNVSEWYMPSHININKPVIIFTTGFYNDTLFLKTCGNVFLKHKLFTDEILGKAVGINLPENHCDTIFIEIHSGGVTTLNLPYNKLLKHTYVSKDKDRLIYFTSDSAIIFR